jgi:hypothetical protein
MLVNNDLERMWKEAVVSQFEVQNRHFLRRTGEATQNPGMAGLMALILTWCLQNLKECTI